MVRMLRRWKAKREVNESIKQLECSVCRELQLPRSTHQGVEKKTTHFGHVLSFDEPKVTLADRRRQTLLILLDEASSSAILIPMQSKQPSFQELSQALSKAWFSWAGAPAFCCASIPAAHIHRSRCATFARRSVRRCLSGQPKHTTNRAAPSVASTSSRTRCP